MYPERSFTPPTHELFRALVAIDANGRPIVVSIPVAIPALHDDDGLVTIAAVAVSKVFTIMVNATGLNCCAERPNSNFFCPGRYCAANSCHCGNYHCKTTNHGVLLSYPYPLTTIPCGGVCSCRTRLCEPAALISSLLSLSKLRDFLRFIVINVRELVSSAFAGSQQLIELCVHRLRIPILGTLNEQRHQPNRQCSASFPVKRGASENEPQQRVNRDDEKGRGVGRRLP